MRLENYGIIGMMLAIAAALIIGKYVFGLPIE